MTHSQRLAAFVRRASYDMISPEARDQLKIRVLDSLACAFGALPGDPISRIRAQTEEFGGAPICTLIGDGKSSPDRTAFKVRRQSLAEKAASPANTYNQRYPNEFPAHVIVRPEDGRILETEKCEYDGFWSRPQTWESAVRKFERLAGVERSAAACRRICETVKHLEDTNIAALTALLGKSDGVAELKAA